MHGFVVLECEEIERAALLCNSDFNPRLKLIKNGLHLLAAPSQQSWPRRSLRSWTACAAGKSKSAVEAREQKVESIKTLSFTFRKGRLTLTILAKMFATPHQRIGHTGIHKVYVGPGQ